MKFRTLSIVLIVSLITTLCGTGMAFASTGVQQLSDDIMILSVEQNEDTQKVVLSENGNITEIEITEDNKSVTTVITYKSNEKEDYFFVDKKSNMLYSSITGKTISLDNESDSNNISTFATSPNNGSLKISYKTMHDALGKVSEIVTVAGLMLTMLSAKLPYPVLTTVAIIVDTFGYVLSIIVNKIPSGKASKGGQIKYEKVTYTKHQAGNIFYTYKYKVTGLGTY